MRHQSSFHEISMNEKLIMNALSAKVAPVLNSTDIPKETFRPWLTMKLRLRGSSLALSLSPRVSGFTS